MKRSESWSLGMVSILSATILLTSCKREVAAPAPSTTRCQIKKIIQKIPGLEQRTGEFTYNKAGDPVDFTPQGYGTGSVKYEFRYDKQGRLTDYIGYYPASIIPGNFEFWRRFVYDDKGRIIRDTAYHYGPYGSLLTIFSNYKIVTDYEYDLEQRVSRKVWRQLVNNVPNGIVGDYKYLYNGQGNLITPGAVYDDKVSVYRLNKIWMFLNCNYSENNLLKGTSYNQYGLPLGFGRITQPTPILGLLGFLGFNDVEIQYECK